MFFCVVLLLWTCGSQARAQPGPAFPVAVWLQGRDDDALKARIEGQTADLDVTLVPIERDGLALPSRERLAVAGGLLQQSGARALLFWEPSPRGGRRLRVLHGERVFSRELGGAAADEPVRSATLESAAVVVRAVLRTLLAGEEAGVSLSEALAAEPEAAPGPVQVPVPVVAAEPEPPKPPPGRRLGLVASLGWQVAIDGQSPPGQHALSLSVGLTVSRILIRLWLLGGLPASLRDEASVLSLSRHGAALGVLGAVVQRERLRLLVGVTAGLCGYYRKTDAVADGYEATAPRFVPALCTAPQISLWLRPARRVPLYVELLAGIELAFGRPRLGYGEGDTFVARGDLWPVQPVFGLSLLYARARAADGSAR